MASDQIMADQGYEKRWEKVGRGLHKLNILLQDYVKTMLQTHLDSIPRLDPNNDSAGVHLCYRALPHHDLTVELRQMHLEMHLEQTQHAEEGAGKRDPARAKNSGLLQGRNQPIPIRNEDELAHLYLSEFYKKQQSCNISNLDLSAILKILRAASCFPKEVKVLASKVEDKVRQLWNLAVFEMWTEQRTNEAFAQLEQLAQLVSKTTLTQLGNDSFEEDEGFQFPGQEFLKTVRRYRSSINLLKRPESEEGVKRVDVKYLKRRFKDLRTGQETSNIEDLVMRVETVFLRGLSGSGKSSEISRILSDWAKGLSLKPVVCCFKIAIEPQQETMSLNEMFWKNLAQIPGPESFDHLEKLASEGRIAIIFDRVDNLGTLTKDDLKEATKAASQPHVQTSLKVLCLGILTKRLLPGAKLIATIGSFFVPNDILANPSMSVLYDIEDLNKEEIEELVATIEDDEKQQKIINDRLCEIVNAGHHHLVKTPMLVNSLIDLIRRRSLGNKISDNEVYLALFTRNMSFSTETESTEDLIYFLRFLKLFQMQVACTVLRITNRDNIMMQVQGNDSDRAINGSILSLENASTCFEVDEFTETLQIPVEFILRLRGLFEFTMNGTQGCVQPIHKSFVRFSCALSLCLNVCDLQYELSEIKGKDNYIAIVLHMAALLSSQASLNKELIALKQLCGANGEQERRRKMHLVYESITSRGSRIFASEGVDVHITLASGEKIKTNSKVTNLLVEVMRASGELVSLALARVILPRVADEEWQETKSVFNLIQLLQNNIRGENMKHNNDSFQFTSLKFATNSDYIRLCAFFSLIQGWTLDFLDHDAKQKEVYIGYIQQFSPILFQVLKKLTCLVLGAKVETVKITKPVHNICVTWGSKEASWSLRRVKKEKGTPLIQQVVAAGGTKLEFQLEHGKGSRQPSSEESEKERENSEENKSM